MVIGKKELKSEKIYRAVANMVYIHRFEPGIRINVEELTRELHVSRGSAWEAIRRLEQEGVLENIPNRGVFMVKNTLEHAIEQIQVRTALDRLAGKLAGERVNDRLIERLAHCLEGIMSAIESAELTAYSKADGEFHRLIYDASGNKYLGKMVDSVTLQLRTIPSQATIPIILSSFPALYEAHREVVQGLAARDPDRVDKAMFYHGDLVVANVREQIIAERERKKIVRRILKPLDIAGKQAKKSKSSKDNTASSGKGGEKAETGAPADES